MGLNLEQIVSNESFRYNVMTMILVVCRFGIKFVLKFILLIVSRFSVKTVQYLWWNSDEVSDSSHHTRPPAVGDGGGCRW